MVATLSIKVHANKPRAAHSVFLSLSHSHARTHTHTHTHTHTQTITVMQFASASDWAEMDVARLGSGGNGWLQAAHTMDETGSSGRQVYTNDRLPQTHTHKSAQAHLQWMFSHIQTGKHKYEQSENLIIRVNNADTCLQTLTFKECYQFFFYLVYLTSFSLCLSVQNYTCSVNFLTLFRILTHTLKHFDGNMYLYPLVYVKPLLSTSPLTTHITTGSPSDFVFISQRK